MKYKTLAAVVVSAPLVSGCGILNDNWRTWFPASVESPSMYAGAEPADKPYHAPNKLEKVVQQYK